MDINNLQWILIGCIMVINDIISFGITKEVSLQNNLKSIYWLIIPTVLYGSQIWLFYYGLKKTSMSVLNITWNLFSNILVTLVGVYYFKEQVTNIKTIAILLALSSIILFTYDGAVKQPSL